MDEDYYDNDVIPVKTPSPQRVEKDYQTTKKNSTVEADSMPENQPIKDAPNDSAPSKNQDDNEECVELTPGFKWFYHLYRLKQRTSGLIWGLAEGFFTGGGTMGKWGGGGGFLMGSITQLSAIIIGPVYGMVTFGTAGLLSDRHTVAQMAKDYRYSMGAGGVPPTHGSFS